MELISDFLNSNEPLIADKASKINELFQQYQAKAISEDEYNELVEDLVDIEKVTSNIGDIEERQKIIKLCNGLISVAKMLIKA